MASPTPGKTQLGLEPNLAAMLCYLPLCCAGLILSVVAVVVEKENRFVRFHAFQSLLVHAALMVLGFGGWFFSIALSMLSGFLGLVVSVILAPVGLALLGAMIFLMIKAYGNELFKLPVVGDLAQNWANQ
jgi:uncharacterized membrane protein